VAGVSADTQNIIDLANKLGFAPADLAARLAGMGNPFPRPKSREQPYESIFKKMAWQDRILRLFPNSVTLDIGKRNIFRFSCDLNVDMTTLSSEQLNDIIYLALHTSKPNKLRSAICELMRRIALQYALFLERFKKEQQARLNKEQLERLLQSDKLEPKVHPPPLEWRPQQQTNAPNYSI
jgi:hypothetical protein